MAVEPGEPRNGERCDAWQRFQGRFFASDLLSTALVLGAHQEANEAAEYRLATENLPATTQQAALAVLGRRAETAIQAPDMRSLVAAFRSGDAAHRATQ